MQSMYYTGLDVHKRTISYCVKDGGGKIHAEDTIPATRFDSSIPLVVAVPWYGRLLLRPQLRLMWNAADL